MSTVSRWFTPVLLAAGFIMAAALPATVQAQYRDPLSRVIVDIADVVFRTGTPYYRNGHHGQQDQLIVVRDRYGRPTYYRQVSHPSQYRPPQRYVQHRPAPHYYSNPQTRYLKCNPHGKCKVQQRGHAYGNRYDNRYSSHNRHDRHDRDHDDRRWSRGRDRDDD